MSSPSLSYFLWFQMIFFFRIRCSVNWTEFFLLKFRFCFGLVQSQFICTLYHCLGYLHFLRISYPWMLFEYIQKECYAAWNIYLKCCIRIMKQLIMRCNWKKELLKWELKRNVHRFVFFFFTYIFIFKNSMRLENCIYTVDS